MMFGWRKRFAGIPGIKNFSKIHPIAGLSKSEKYRVETKCGDFLLVLGDALEYTRMQKQIKWLNHLEANNIATNRVLDFGTYNSGQRCYMILSWTPGEEVETLLHNKSSLCCTQLGALSGRLLKEIHGILPECNVSEAPSLKEEMEICIAEYSKEYGLLSRYPSMETFIRFLDNNKSRAVLNTRPTLLHGDFHAKNLIYSDGKINAIDWDNGKLGNPIEDFVRNIISAEVSYHFASSLIKSYYDTNIPDDFWLLLAIYTAIHELRITKYEFESPQKKLSFVDYQHGLVLKEYCGMRSLIPNYYAKCNTKEDYYEY